MAQSLDTQAQSQKCAQLTRWVFILLLVNVVLNLEIVEYHFNPPPEARSTRSMISDVCGGLTLSNPKAPSPSLGTAISLASAVLPSQSSQNSSKGCFCPLHVVAASSLETGPGAMVILLPRVFLHEASGLSPPMA